MGGRGLRAVLLLGVLAGWGAAQSGEGVESVYDWNTVGGGAVLPGPVPPPQVDPWLLNALETQRRLAEKVPLSETTILGSHNAYAATNYRYTAPGGGMFAGGYPYPNHIYNITEQMQLGMRQLELDVHFIPEWGGADWYLCHGSGRVARSCQELSWTACETFGVKNQGNHSGFCIYSEEGWQPQTFQAGLAEIAHFLKFFRYEVIVIRLEYKENSGGQTVEERDAAMNEMILEAFDVVEVEVWTPEDTEQLGGAPTPNEMRAKGKQVLVWTHTSSTDFGGEVVHRREGLLGRPTFKTRYFVPFPYCGLCLNSEGAKMDWVPADPTGDPADVVGSCHGVLPLPRHWTGFYADGIVQGLTGSSLGVPFEFFLANGVAEVGLVYPEDMRLYTQCGFQPWLDLATVDHTLASVWSWARNEPPVSTRVSSAIVDRSMYVAAMRLPKPAEGPEEGEAPGPGAWFLPPSWAGPDAGRWVALPRPGGEFCAACAPPTAPPPANLTGVTYNVFAGEVPGRDRYPEEVWAVACTEGGEEWAKNLASLNPGDFMEVISKNLCGKIAPLGPAKRSGAVEGVSYGGKWVFSRPRSGVSNRVLLQAAHEALGAHPVLKRTGTLYLAWAFNPGSQSWSDGEGRGEYEELELKEGEKQVLIAVLLPLLAGITLFAVGAAWSFVLKRMKQGRMGMAAHNLLYDSPLIPDDEVDGIWDMFPAVTSLNKSHKARAVRAFRAYATRSGPETAPAPVAQPFSRSQSNVRSRSRSSGGEEGAGSMSVSPQHVRRHEEITLDPRTRFMAPRVSFMGQDKVHFIGENGRNPSEIAALRTAQGRDKKPTHIRNRSDPFSGGLRWERVAEGGGGGRGEENMWDIDLSRTGASRDANASGVSPRGSGGSQSRPKLSGHSSFAARAASRLGLWLSGRRPMSYSEDTERAAIYIDQITILNSALSEVCPHLGSARDGRLAAVVLDAFGLARDDDLAEGGCARVDEQGFLRMAAWAAEHLHAENIVHVSELAWAAKHFRGVNSTLGALDLQRLMHCLCEDLTLEEVNELLRRIQKEGRAKVQLTDLVAALMAPCPSEEAGSSAIGLHAHAPAPGGGEEDDDPVVNIPPSP